MIPHIFSPQRITDMPAGELPRAREALSLTRAFLAVAKLLDDADMNQINSMEGKLKSAEAAFDARLVQL